MFCVLMRDFGLRSQYRPTMSGLTLRLYQFECLIEELYPELHVHFNEMMIPTSAYASPWFMTLFGATLPLPCVERLMDLFVLDATDYGMLVPFRCGLAILGMNHDRLLQANFDGILRTLNRAGLEECYTGREDALMAAMHKLGTSVVSGKKLSRFEKTFTVVQAKEQARVSELERTKRQRDRLAVENDAFRASNTELHATVKGLETDIQLMAAKLAAQAFTLSEADETIERLRLLVGVQEDESITTM